MSQTQQKPTPEELSMSMFASSADYWKAMYEATHASHQRLQKALSDALQPLDLYHAYGWHDRNGVRGAGRMALASIPKVIA